MVDAEHLPAVAAPMALAFPAPRPRHRPPHHRTFYAHPSAHAHPHPSERGPMHACVHLQAHACAGGSSPRRTHALVTPRWAHSRSTPSSCRPLGSASVRTALAPCLAPRAPLHTSHVVHSFPHSILALGGGGGCIHPRQPNACMHASILA